MDTLTNMSAEMSLICRYVGVMGFVLYMAGFGALQLQLLDGNGALYSLINIAAATFVLISLAVEFNLASALIQVSWILIGGAGIAIRQMKRRSEEFGWVG